jgi:hypothetical protein
MPVNIREIKDKGGNKIAIIEVDDNYAVKTPVTEGVTAIDLGHISGSDFEQSAGKEEYRSEDGIVRASDYEYTIKTTGILMQRSKKIIDFLTLTVKDKFYLQYKYMGIVGGRHQEVFAVVRVTPQTKIATPGASKSFPYEATHIAPGGTITISAQDIADIKTELGINVHTAGPVTIPANQEFVIVETDIV